MICDASALRGSPLEAGGHLGDEFIDVLTLGDQRRRHDAGIAEELHRVHGASLPWCGEECNRHARILSNDEWSCIDNRGPFCYSDTTFDRLVTGQ